MSVEEPAPTDPEPQPNDGPDYHADHQAWESRRDAADPVPTDDQPWAPGSTWTRAQFDRTVLGKAADPAPTDRSPDRDVHTEACHSSECPCYWEGRHGRPRPAADPAPTGDQP